MKTNRYWYNWIALVALLLLWMAGSNPDNFWNPTLDHKAEIEYNVESNRQFGHNDNLKMPSRTLI